MTPQERRAAARAQRLDRQYGQPVVLIDTEADPVKTYEIRRARVGTPRSGVKVEDGQVVAVGHDLEVRMSTKHWPKGLAVPDPETYPADRLRVIRGALPAGDPAIAGSPVATVKTPPGVVVLEVVS